MGHNSKTDSLTDFAQDSKSQVAVSAFPNDVEAPVRNSPGISRTLNSRFTSENEPSEKNQLNRRLLVFDCHEAWVYQLRFLGLPMDVVVGLHGRYKNDWDEAMRPLPPKARLVRPNEIAHIAGQYHCIIAHNLSDLLDVKSLSGPRLLVLHETLNGNLLEQGAAVTSTEMKRAVAKFTQLTNTHVVAVSKLKGKSWGFSDDIVPFSAALEDYPAWQGDIARGLRIANHIMRRPRVFDVGVPQTGVWRPACDISGPQPGNEGRETFGRLDGFKGYSEPSQILYSYRQSTA